MKRKTLVLTSISLALVAIAVWTLLRPSGNIDASSRDFSVKDTSRITKIFLGDRSGNTITLLKGEGNLWTVNDSMAPNLGTLKRLLHVIHSVSVKNRVAKAAYNNVVGELAAVSIKVEIYLDGSDSPEKTYYVGGHTQDALGTFMILEGSDLPFVTEIPGFNGYLTPWYPTRLDDWRSNTVFEYKPADIRKIQIDYPAFTEKSFLLELDDSTIGISSRKEPVNSIRVERKKLDNYLIHFQRLPYLQEARMLGGKERDSLAKVVPLAVVMVTLFDGSQRSVQLYPMPISDRSLVKEDDKGRPLEYDLDHMYCKMDRWPYWVVVQHYTFDPILQKSEELIRVATSID